MLGMLPKMLSRLSTRDTWLTRNAPGGFFRRGRSGHVACSEGFQTESHGLGTRGHVVLSEGFRTESHSLGTRRHVAFSEGFRRRFRRGLRAGFRDTWHAPKEGPKGGR